MPYLDIQTHVCSNPKCRKTYEWDCHVPDPMNAYMYTVVTVKSCVHAKLQERVNYETTDFPITVNVNIKCPYCATIDEEQIIIDRV